jgi:dihydropteroate synthase
MYWKTARRTIEISRPLVMGILNVTPDSFSDGGQFGAPGDAIRRAEQMTADGADIIDIGGESTRPGSLRISDQDEIARVVPVIEALAERADIPLSIDTSKAVVASAAIGAGAEIINDIAGLRWEPEIADVAAAAGAGLVLMHSRGSFEMLHAQPAVDDIFSEVASGLASSIKAATSRGVTDGQIVLDIGLGFGKTLEQNLALIAKLDKLVSEFAAYPMLVGASRKSIIGKVLDDAPVSDRLGGSLAAAVIAVQRGAHIVRVHDVKETVAALRVIDALSVEK